MTVCDALHALVRGVPDDVTWAVTAAAVATNPAPGGGDRLAHFL